MTYKDMLRIAYDSKTEKSSNKENECNENLITF